MRFGRILLSSSILLAAAVPALALTHARRSPTSPKLISKRPKAAARRPSQASIDPQRATEIQNALIKSGYLSGEPSGTWDANSQAAMQKLQADNGWQTKLVPDSRAIIKLGLGPAQDNVASETSPNPPSSSY
jgi:Putative peptidoglycan binding domain